MARCFHEAVGDFPEVPSAEKLHDLIPNGFYLWYPLGKFAMILVEVHFKELRVFRPRWTTSWMTCLASSRRRTRCDRVLCVFCALSVEAADPNEEYRILPMGVKK